MDELNSKNEVGEDIEYGDASSNEKETEVKIFVKTLEKEKHPWHMHW